MHEATVARKGQVTIPADIRRALGLDAGERVVFTRLDEGTTVMRAKTRSVVDLRGMLKKKGRRTRKVKLEDMDIGNR